MVRRWMLWAASVLPAFCGCRLFSRSTPPPGQTVAPGIVLHSLPAGDETSPASAVYVLDVDLRRSDVRPRVVTQAPAVQKNRVFANSYTVREWCERSGAVGGINGGFFGQTDGDRKEVIGLLAAGGAVVSSGRLVRSTSHPGRRFARCVLAFTPDGLPHIGWAVGERGRSALLTAFTQPVNPVSQAYWNAESAVACGPRLVEGSRTHVTDREERLVNPPRLWRTFVGYSMEAERPRFLALCIGQSMTFADAAEFLQRYFRRYHGVACQEGMCLDGGASSQLVYRAGSELVDVRPNTTTVPDAVVVAPRAVRADR